ncbi:hypothetical protein NQ318_023581 [Aromia moschata]|uniref:DDE Tnp4 domain-containing protein n=1 Tax=Aromia moschata TaxID=1265417 RepID=A0AAV8YRM4_9CUCU|nr:hypothetical protein NQ318_023581 [Aromia moschata]
MKYNRNKKLWVRPIFTERMKRMQGHSENLIMEMRLNDPEKYFNYLRMTPLMFDKLLEIVGPQIERQCFVRDPIPVTTRLELTLRYLADGSTWRHAIKDIMQIITNFTGGGIVTKNFILNFQSQSIDHCPLSPISHIIHSQAGRLRQAPRSQIPQNISLPRSLNCGPRLRLEIHAGHLTKKWTNFIHKPIQPEETLVVTLSLEFFSHAIYPVGLCRAPLWLKTKELDEETSLLTLFGYLVNLLRVCLLHSVWAHRQLEKLLKKLSMYCGRSYNQNTCQFHLQKCLKILESKEYFKVWNFPNCLRALDGKHVKIKCPSHSGSMYYNYKQYFSIVLQGVCDVKYRFTMIDVGGFGTFQSSNMYKLLSKKKLNIPEDRCLPNTNIKMPFRLSRAHKTIECSFGILYSKWRILSKAIETDEKTADKIKANQSNMCFTKCDY